MQSIFVFIKKLVNNGFILSQWREILILFKKNCIYEIKY
jgi:hypothetical protein